MQLGFSYVGLIYLMMLLLPNIIWTKHQPRDYEKYVNNENKILLIMERSGEILVSCTVLVFSDFNIKPWSNRSWWLVISLIFMVLYEIYWVQYFKSEKTMRDFYRSLLGIPVAGATLPVAAFILLAVYGKNVILAIAVLILGIGHIGIHFMHKREVNGEAFHLTERKSPEQ